MRVIVLLVAVLLLAAPAWAQIEDRNPRVENRRALRAARKQPAPYKESHLAVNKTSLKRGEGGKQAQPKDGREAYEFDNTGTARVSEPSQPTLRLRKKKKAARQPHSPAPL